MPGEQGSDKSGAPDGICPTTQKQEEKNRIGYVEQQVRKMVAPSFQSKYLHIHHMRNPGQRVPIGRIASCKGPPDRLYGQSILNPRVLGDILGVIEVVKLVALNRPIKEDRDKAQQEADYSNAGRIAGITILRFERHSCGSISLQTAAAKPILCVFLNFVASLRNGAKGLKSVV